MSPIGTIASNSAAIIALLVLVALAGCSQIKEAAQGWQIVPQKVAAGAVTVTIPVGWFSDKPESGRLVIVSDKRDLRAGPNAAIKGARLIIETRAVDALKKSITAAAIKSAFSTAGKQEIVEEPAAETVDGRSGVALELRSTRKSGKTRRAYIVKYITVAVPKRNPHQFVLDARASQWKSAEKKFDALLRTAEFAPVK